MLSTLDQLVIPPTRIFELQNTLGRFGGIGIVIETHERRLRVLEVMPRTPAAKAGVAAGEIVTEINDDTTENISLADSAELLRGPIGSRVRLTLLDPRKKTTRVLQLTRDRIEVRSANGQRMHGGIGHIEIAHFQENTAKEVAEIIKGWHGKLNGLILDVRGNPGGLLDQAIAVSDLFLSKGEIVTTVGHQHEPTHTHVARAKVLDKQTPVVVLVDEYSASASEILAAAFQENGRGLVFGKPTFGKGTVQMLFNFRVISDLN